MTVQSALTTAEHVARLSESISQLRTHADASLRVPAPLSAIAQAQGLQAEIYTVAFAGQTGPGTLNVQVNGPAGGFSSDWPDWAFELAKAALLANKQVWVASNGDPFGTNLVFVMIMQ